MDLYLTKVVNGCAKYIIVTDYSSGLDFNNTVSWMIRQSDTATLVNPETNEQVSIHPYWRGELTEEELTLIRLGAEYIAMSEFNPKGFFYCPYVPVDVITLTVKISKDK